MKVIIAAVGRVKDRALRAALDEYFGRVRRYVACEEVELPDGPAEKVRAAFAKVTVGATVIALEVGGRSLTSEVFARELERYGTRGRGVVAFLIGGADGLPKETSEAANERLSLSALTFPHRLARLVLIEQIYRAMTILRGEPYAH